MIIVLFGATGLVERGVMREDVGNVRNSGSCAKAKLTYKT